MKYQAIVLAAGNSIRSGLSYHKIFYKLDDKTMIEHSISLFLKDEECDKVIIVVHFEDEVKIKEIIHNQKVVFVIGGQTRQESVKKGLEYVDTSYVIIHDGARPYFSNQLLTQLKLALKSHDCVIPVISLNDSIKKVSNHKVEYSLNREEYKLVQCPQGFLTKQIKLAHSLAKKGDYTDDSSLIEDILHQEVFCINGERKNRKYTNEEDF